MKPTDMLTPSEHDVLVNARNAKGQPYKIVHIPVTSKNIGSTGFKGLYVNYYVGNDVVIVPTFNDQNDAQALKIVEGIYPSRKVVGINVEELWEDGGGPHCVTMQQPVGSRRRRD